MEMISSDRYSRQVQVNSIGESGQDQIARTSVLLVGCGGLGCQVGALLAGAGVGKIILVDHDSVSRSNLHRQVLFREKDIGQSKSQIALCEMQAINSEIDIVAHDYRLTSANINTIAEGCDIVIDAADNFLTSFLLSRYCSEHKTPLVSASVNRTFGWVGVFCQHGESPLPGVDAVFTHLDDKLVNCDVVGVTGPSVAMIAGIQAQEVLKVAVGDSQQLAGKLLYLDLWNYQQHTIDFSDAKSITDNIAFLTTNEVKNDDVVLDVRETQEIVSSPHNFDSVLTIPLAILHEQKDQLPTDKRLVCACASGQRALMAALQLHNLGFDNLAVLQPDSVN